jgi:anthranilate 1,2-dioxygenase large subunit
MESSPQVSWPRQDYSRIPFALYHDPDIYALEQKRIFRGPVWNILCLEAEIPNAGDFILCYVGDTQVVVNRDDDRNLHAFVNRCAHRGAEVVREPRGNAKDFVCIYHAWCYNRKGELTGVPFRRGANGRGGMPDTFDQKQHNLQTVRVASFNGVVFGTFHAGTEPLESFLGPLMVEHIGELFSKPIRILGYQRQRIAANWKLYPENIKDAYHGSLLHEFNRTFGLSRLTQVAGGYMDDKHRHSILFQYSGSDSDEAALRAYIEAGVQRGELLKLNDYGMVKIIKENKFGMSTRVINVFPNGFFHQIANTLAMRKIRTLGIDGFELTWTLFGYEDDSDEMTAHRLNQANMVGPAGLISMEDGEALEIVHRATGSSDGQSGVVEMGGVGPIGDRDTRVNEVTIRGFWAYYAQLMGIAPAGAVQ